MRSIGNMLVRDHFVFLGAMMETIESQAHTELQDYAVAVMDAEGGWSSAGSVALRDALRRRSAPGVTDLLMSMDPASMQRSLVEAGFTIPPSLVERDREEVFAAVREDLKAALAKGVDGYGRSSDPVAAKGNTAKPQQRTGVSVPMGFSEKDFAGNFAAAQVIQSVMRNASVSVELLGPAKPGQRSAMQFIAGQALEKGVQGFAFDGVAGKYEVPLSMHDLVGLHGDAAQAVAEESVRAGLGQWAAGSKVVSLSDWVPDSTQRLLQGTISVASAQAIVQSLDGGVVAERAREVGAHTFTSLLNAQGLDIDAKTIADQAQEMGLAIQEPDRMRGKYFGPVVGVDHRACLVKFTRTEALELPFKALAAGQEPPKVGEAVSMAFKAGALSVAMARPLAREGSNR